MALSDEKERRYQELKARAAGAAPDISGSVAFTPEKEQRYQELKARVGQVPLEGAVQANLAAPADTTAAAPPESTDTVNPQLEELNDWGLMPEMRSFFSAPGATMNALAGTVAANSPEDAAAVIQTQFPGVRYRREGDYGIFTSGDGSDYVWKVGRAQGSDFARLAAGMGAGALVSAAGAAIAPAAATAFPLLAGAAKALPTIARAIGGAGSAFATSDLLEQAKERAGGQQNPVAAPLSAVLAGGIPLVGKAVRVGANFIRPGTFPAPAAPAEGLRGAATLLQQGTQDEQAAYQAAQRLKPDPKMAADAADLGVVDKLMAEHLATDDAAVGAMAAIRAGADTRSGAREAAGIRDVAAQFKALFEEWGANPDKTALDAKLLRNTGAMMDDAAERADQAYKAIAKKMTPGADAPADELIAFIENRVKDMKPKPRYTALETEILTELKSRTKLVEQSANSIAAGGPAFKEVTKHPSYATLDSITRKIGRSLDYNSPFPAEDIGLNKALYALAQDIRDKAIERQAPGLGKELKGAQALVKMRKLMEDRAEGAFGPQGSKVLGGSILPQMGRAMSAIEKGNMDPFRKLVLGVPKEARSELVRTMISGVLKPSSDKSQGLGGVIAFMGKLQANPRAYRTVMMYAGPEFRDGLNKMTNISKGIMNAVSRQKQTGVRGTIYKDAASAADRLLVGLFSVADKAMGIVNVAPQSRAAARLLLSGRSGEGPVFEALDNLIMSDKFASFVAGTAQPLPPGRMDVAIKSFMTQKPFERFANAVGVPESEREALLRTLVTGAGRQAIQQNSGGQPVKEEKE